jgi:hypothetical protein
VDVPNELARPTDADREYAARVLRAAVSTGNVEWDDFERLLDNVFAAATLAELRAVTAGLPLPLPNQPAKTPKQAPRLAFAIAIAS